MSRLRLNRGSDHSSHFINPYDIAITMGSMLEAACSCGYNAYAELGAGMENFLTECYAPFHCSSCRSVVNADLMVAAPLCPKCGASGIVPYTGDSLQGEPGTRDVADWNALADRSRRVSLSDGTYLCPACGKTTLQFTSVGSFD